MKRFFSTLIMLIMIFLLISVLGILGYLVWQEFSESDIADTVQNFVSTVTSIGEEKEDYMNKIAVLIPCYNEELTVGKVIKDFKRELPEADI